MAASAQSVMKWASNIAMIIALLMISLSINSAQCRLVTPPVFPPKPASTSTLPPANSIHYKPAPVSGAAPPPYRPVPPPPITPSSLDLSPVLKRVYAPRPSVTTVSATHPSAGSDSAGSGSSVSNGVIGGTGARLGTGGLDIPPINVPVIPGTGRNVYSP